MKNTIAIILLTILLFGCSVDMSSTHESSAWNVELPTVLDKRVTYHNLVCLM